MFGGAARSRGSDRGQASVELVAAIPALLLATLIAAQIAIAGYALWSAAIAARAGARAVAIGEEGAPAARRALPQPLRGVARVRERGPIEVRVRVPKLIPGLPGFAVSASSGLTPPDG